MLDGKAAGGRWKIVESPRGLRLDTVGRNSIESFVRQQKSITEFAYFIAHKTSEGTEAKPAARPVRAAHFANILQIVQLMFRRTRTAECTRTKN